MARQRPPATLGEAGRKFWLSVLKTYELSPAELVTLERACVGVDALAAMDASIAEEGLVVRGSRGQRIPNRLIKLRLEAEQVLDVQLRSLALPMPDERAGRRRSPSAVAAAQTRWREQRG